MSSDTLVLFDPARNLVAPTAIAEVSRKFRLLIERFMMQISKLQIPGIASRRFRPARLRRVQFEWLYTVMAKW
jgi:hypothetical protein